MTKETIGKKAIAFSLDAFLAVTIIIVTLVILLQIQHSENENMMLYYYANDITTMFANTKLHDINNKYIEKLTSEGIIDDTSRTLMEQIAIFWSERKLDLARNLFINVTNNLVPENINYGLWIDDYVIHSRGYPSSKELVSSKRLISGVTENKSVEGYSARVAISSISPEFSSYLYFGGYVGEGNISGKLFLADPLLDVKKIYLELDIANDFDLYINNQFSGHYDVATDELYSDKFTVASSYYHYLKAGENIFKIVSTKKNFIGGGYIRVDYITDNLAYSEINYNGAYATEKKFLPRINGLINYYDSFYPAGKLTSLELYLDYNTTYPVFFTIGDKIVYESNQTGHITALLGNSDLSYLNYSLFSKQTTPIRMGHKPSNITTISGSPVDTVLETDVSTSMDQIDVPGAPGKSRLDVAKEADHLFVDIVLNYTGTRVGLVSYHSSTEPGQAVDLTRNKQELHTQINKYHTKSVNTCFACAINDAIEMINTHSTPETTKVIVLMSDGTSDKCYNIPQSKCTVPVAKQQALNYSCIAWKVYGIKVFTIGFGEGADSVLLNQMANCGNGSFYQSYNYSQILGIYENIAYQIVSMVHISYNETQTLNVSNVNSSLDFSSYVKYTYLFEIPKQKYGDITLFRESGNFGNSVAETYFYLPEKVKLIDLKATSYSSNKWTSLLSVRNKTAYELDRFYLTNYSIIGDPFIVNIPPDMITNGIENLITVKTAVKPREYLTGSPDNKLIYSIRLNMLSNYTDVYPKAEGCKWLVMFYDNTISYFYIPEDYSGNKTCYYANQTFMQDDAIDVAAYEFFRTIDFDNDGKIDIKLTQDDITTSTLKISKIPTLYGPSTFDVRLWY